MINNNPPTYTINSSTHQLINWSTILFADPVGIKNLPACIKQPTFRLEMGAGISVADNAAQAVASAVTSVINNTNVFNDQDNTQKQTISLNACDIVAANNVDINQQAGLTQSLTQIASIASTTTVSNDVAQALSQAATSQVGAGVLGIADASNQASTYASMATNVANYVQLSAKQKSKTEQTFECNNSTIVANNVSISQVQIDNVQQFTNDDVTNSTDVTNKIQQTIEQTASATTGFSIGGIIALIVALAVIALAVKMFSKPNNANNANNPNDQSHSQRIMNAVQQGHTHDTVDDVDNIRVSKATWIIYLVMIVLFGLVICAWYISAGMQGCLFDDACGTRVGAVGGCSCNFNETGDGTNVCKDTTSASFTSTGLPLKYQYVLAFHQAQSVMCTNSNSTSTASMQGILVSYFKLQSMTINANNGKNLSTLLRYVKMCAGAWPNDDKADPAYNMPLPIKTQTVQSIVNMFRAGAKYLASLTNVSDTMKILTSCLVDNDTNYEQSAIRLALMCCPLRPVFITSDQKAAAASWPNQFSTAQTCLTVADVSNWVSSADASKSYLVQVPQAFTSIKSHSTTSQTANYGAGCCSTRMMQYIDSTDKTNAFDFTNNCGDNNPSGGDPDDATTYYTQTGTFCNGCTASDTGDKACAPSTQGAGGPGPAGQTITGENVNATGQVQMKLPGSGDVATMMTAYPVTPTPTDDDWSLQYYAELASFDFPVSDDAELAYSFVRLMWTGIMAAIGDQPADTVFGTNAMLVNAGAVDHYYVASQTGEGFGRVGSSLDDQAGAIDDKTLLRIKMVNDSKYSCQTGLPPVACSNIGNTSLTQSYIGSSSALGYCRDWFLNDYSRIVMFVLAALAVIWLPMFVIVRIYINRGTGKILVEDAQAHLNSKAANSANSSNSGKSSKSANSAKSTKSAKSNQQGKSEMVAPFTNTNGNPQPDEHNQTIPTTKTSSAKQTSQTSQTSQASPASPAGQSNALHDDLPVEESDESPPPSDDSVEEQPFEESDESPPSDDSVEQPVEPRLSGGYKRRPAWMARTGQTKLNRR